MHDQYQGAVDVEHNFVHLFMFLDRHTEFPGHWPEAVSPEPEIHFHSLAVLIGQSRK